MGEWANENEGYTWNLQLFLLHAKESLYTNPKVFFSSKNGWW